MSHLMKVVIGAVSAMGMMALDLPSGAAAMAATTPRYTFALITHGQSGDAFWDVVRKGAQAAANNDGVKLIYLPNPTESGEAQMVSNALQQNVEGIAVTLAFPQALSRELKQAAASGVPMVAVNAGSGDWQQMGMLTYVGTDELGSGMSVGDRLNTLGVKNVICLDHQQGAIQLENRCDGIRKTLMGKVTVLYVPGLDMAAAQSRLIAKLQQDPTIDYIVTLDAPFVGPALTAVSQAGSKAEVGTFGIDGQAIKLIQQGKLQWAIDIQPYLQGYEAIDLLYLYKANGDLLGGGGPVLTGPTFVTKTNADDVAQFAAQGTR